MFCDVFFKRNAKPWKYVPIAHLQAQKLRQKSCGFYTGARGVAALSGRSLMVQKTLKVKKLSR